MQPAAMQPAPVPAKNQRLILFTIHALPVLRGSGLTLIDTAPAGEDEQSYAELAAAAGNPFSPKFVRPARTFRRLLAELPGM